VGAEILVQVEQEGEQQQTDLFGTGPVSGLFLWRFAHTLAQE
jgi:hypothetical protein